MGRCLHVSHFIAGFGPGTDGGRQSTVDERVAKRIPYCASPVIGMCCAAVVSVECAAATVTTAAVERDNASF